MIRAWVLPALQPWRWPRWVIAGYDGTICPWRWTSRFALATYRER